MKIRQLTQSDRPWAARLVQEQFGSPRVVSRGIIHDTTQLPGLIAEEDTMSIGLLQYRVERNQAEVVIIIAVRQRQGIGRALLQAFHSHGEQSGWRRIWLITTNNNRVGQVFYEAVSMRKCAIYPNAVLAARKLKPDIPEYDAAGVPIRDEIEYEWLLQDTLHTEA